MKYSKKLRQNYEKWCKQNTTVSYNNRCLWWNQCWHALQVDRLSATAHVLAASRQAISVYNNLNNTKKWGCNFCGANRDDRIIGHFYGLRCKNILLLMLILTIITNSATRLQRQEIITSKINPIRVSAWNTSQQPSPGTPLRIGWSRTQPLNHQQGWIPAVEC